MYCIRRYCAPASLIPEALNPTVVIAPAMTITLTTGSCQLTKSEEDVYQGVVTCLPPSIVWEKVA